MPRTKSKYKLTPRRKRLLAAVHIRAKDLGLDDAYYRDLLEDWEGARSCRDLDTDAVQRVADRLGGKHIPKAGPKTITAAQIDRVRTLWEKHARVPTESALRAFSESVTGERRYTMLDQRQARALMSAINRIRK